MIEAARRIDLKRFAVLYDEMRHAPEVEQKWTALSLASAAALYADYDGVRQLTLDIMEEDLRDVNSDDRTVVPRG
jgi:hypothetical protein